MAHKRLTGRQLRHLVESVIEEGLNSTLAVKRNAEMLADGPEKQTRTAHVKALEEKWVSWFDESDPGLAAMGREEWIARCKYAAYLVRGRLVQVVWDVEKELMEDDFSSDDGLE